MDAALLSLVTDRLTTVPPTEAAVADLVLAACAGPPVLRAAMAGSPLPRRGVGIGTATTDTAAGIHLDSLTVEGFRGVGPAVHVALNPYPSLTLIVGRNGSGKSSLAEALELLLTGSNRRWEGPRSEVWRRGWRNLHHPTAHIAASLVVDGVAGSSAVERTWGDADQLDAGTGRVAGPAGGLDGEQWRQALSWYRPFLPHNELGALWDEGPTRLHDALAQILGLEELTAMLATLAAERLQLDQAEKAARASLAPLRTALEQVDDDRARACLAATAGKSWNLAIVEGALDDGASSRADTADAARLGGLSTLTVPDAAAVAERAAALRSAADRLAAAAATDAGRARETASLLRAALAHLRSHPGTDCPVCGTAGATDSAWREATTAEVERLTRVAAEVDLVHARAAQERQRSTALLGGVPAVVRDGPPVAVDTAPLLAAWRAWLAVEPDADLLELAAHLESTHAALADATAAVRDAAAAEVRRREDAWRPCADAVRGWLAGARPVLTAAPLLRTLRAAEQWSKAAEQELRAARFAPIARAVQANWTLLRQDSNVSLDGLRLEGAARSPSRRIALEVSIDGIEGQALGVMSQGELNALALSLFLPRAQLPESPFRFVVVDDPVQAMDPNKIDGLARVLAHAAVTHQVIVFTHDERLPAAVRRLGIESTVLQVTRREGSVVEVTRSLDPVARHLEDAYAVAMSDNLPVAAGRVVPLFCRLALEAACTEVLTRRRLRGGQPLADVETVLAGRRLLHLLAMVVDRDSDRFSSVLERLGRFGENARDVVQRCNRGTHGGDQGDLLWLQEQTRTLATRIRAVS